MKALGAALALLLASPAFGQDAQRAAAGADIYARNCSPCHGARMLDPQGAFDLRQFPRDQRERFVTSVTKGKNAMPPWGDVLKPEEIEALWLYVTAGARD
ncbi:MAG TPA: cytochrome c [Burkholderiales bacterium]|jgi:mono/diheme cytochrome c family protein